MLVGMSIRTLLIVALISSISACGGDDPDPDPDPVDPTDVVFGDTALVVVVNPQINDATNQNVAEPGSLFDGIELTSDDGVTTLTADTGIAILDDLTPGIRTIAVVGDTIDASFTVTMGAGELREIALAVEGTSATVMVEIDYKSDQVAELDPSMTNEQVNEALRVSDQVVFFASGLYAGDLDFSGSRITLFGEGVLGGEVTIDGNVTMSGSDSRLRGTLVTGDVDVPASGCGISFSQVDGSLLVEGSDATLLSNAMCGSTEVDASGVIALGNAGLTPISAGCL